jgi:uncharacterized protein (TIGR02145 family)
MNKKISILTLAVIAMTSITVFFSSCKKDDPMEATSIELVSGADQTSIIETSLANSIVVLVKDQDGNAFQNATVNFAVEEGSVSPATATTNVDGKVSVIWVLGSTEGTQSLTITAFKSDGTTNLSDSPIVVNATATSATTEVTDIDGNIYDIVTIGNQTWMAEDLRTTKYADGTPITNVETDTEWGNLENNNSDKAYCFYDNNENSDYGALYTCAAATNGVVFTTVNVQGVCPDGWHLPNNSEWDELGAYLGYDVAGGKLKEVGTSHWEAPNEGTTNSTGFTALPSGYREQDGAFAELTRLAFWWTSTESSLDYANVWYVNNGSTSIMDKDERKSMGLSVRCVLN